MRQRLFISLLLLGLFSLSMANAAIVIGSPQGRVVLTEVIDYQCPHCQRLAPIIDRLIERYPDLRVRVLPVAVVNHLSLVEASSSWVMAQRYPGHWRAYHQALLTHPMDEATWHRVLANGPLGQTDFQAAMHQDRVRQALLSGLALLKRYPAPHQPPNTVAVPLVIIQSVDHPACRQLFHHNVPESVFAQAIERCQHG